MKKSFIVILFTAQLSLPAYAQDTFSILAFDSITGEIGAAGASCVDLVAFPWYPNDFIAEIFPDTGAVMSQASYQPANQQGARARMRAGDDPSQLLSWLYTNDVQSNPEIRQYGVIKPSATGNRTAAFTGTNCMNYKNHVVGPNYTIHGNILLGQQVLDSMEAGFLRGKGDLACKLMSAMQGANMIGADTRCASNGGGTSSLFAFLKVSLPTDSFGKPTMLISLKTSMGTGKEPIDSLQALFDALRICVENTSNVPKAPRAGGLAIYPNPFAAELSLAGPAGQPVQAELWDLAGRLVLKTAFENSLQLNLADFPRGLYIAELRCGTERLRGKVISY